MGDDPTVVLDSWYTRAPANVTPRQTADQHLDHRMYIPTYVDERAGYKHLKTSIIINLEMDWDFHTSPALHKMNPLLPLSAEEVCVTVESETSKTTKVVNY